MAEKQTSKDRMREIVDSIENGIKELFESDKYRKYLATMSRFHRYSVNNTMLIYMQRPDATHVAGFNKWRDQFGRNVLKGEKGIRIIAPTPYKKKVEEIKTDPETNAPVLDADGKAIIEEKEIRIPMFKVVSVFDVSQTAGKPLPQLAADLSGNVQQYEVFMEALRRASPVPIEIKPVAHLIPDLSLTEQPQAPLGKYGRMRKDYLKEHRPVLWNSLLLSERLYPHLREIDEAANNRLEQMMPELMKSAGVTEALKASDPMKWVGLMNTLKAQAEETILTELVFS